MVIILLLLTLIAMVSVQIVLEKVKQKKEVYKFESAGKNELIIAKPKDLYFPRDRYYSLSHIWVKPSENFLFLGLDDFTSRFIGKIENLKILGEKGKEINEGEVIWILKHSNRVLPQVSPVGGEILEINEKVISNLSLLNESPYKEGWILKIRCPSLDKYISNLLDGQIVDKWMNFVKSYFVHKFHKGPGLVYQSGGIFIDGFGSELSEEDWEIAKIEFFNLYKHKGGDL
ncbi:MAG: hypothetical protein ABIM36_02090 [candidate division WOR-3 bacterium]